MTHFDPEGPDLVVHATDAQLAGMDQVVVDMHTSSGLLEEIRSSTITLEQAGAATGMSETSGELGGALGIAILGSVGTAVYRAEIADRLGTTEGNVRVAVHRLRGRYGLLLREEIAATVGDAAQVGDEIRTLFAALEG